MAAKSNQEVSKEAYKGVRDFYPEQMFFQKYIFEVMRKTTESFGYLEYNASILEPAELYRAKSGEEIVNEQTYTFKDRGDREVTLRPEMTPTVARMIAAKMRELSLPLRWYSIPNLFRYEQPQRGRLREHWQLNVDLFGLDSARADIEVISIAHRLLKNFGAKDDDFVIKINDRRVVTELYEFFKIPEENRAKIGKVLDKKSKISNESFREAIELLIPKGSEDFIKAIGSAGALIETLEESNAAVKRIVDLIDALANMGINNILFEPTLMRGADYYTGTIFEGFDTNEQNKRAIFGGGRYDDLLSIFGNSKMPAIGFGMGDVTIFDFLETHSLLPKYVSTAHLYLSVMEGASAFSERMCQSMRDAGINIVCDYSEKSIGDKIKKAQKDSVPYFAVIGQNEEKTKTVTIKNLATRKEKVFALEGDFSTLAQELAAGAF